MNQNQFRGLMVVLIILLFTIFFSFIKLGDSIREVTNIITNSSDSGVSYELNRLNENFERYLDFLDKQNQE
ncbi:hypothetical protein LIS82_27915 (plasmid) [Cytobacillus solani]|uniref:hypothetical protein n=1 Tax=Cytobacillus solani TaxID=1637975 RepID=UPI00207A9898|nr:hypothetical protein [Cytobacillus solani]USK57802.1 hypothetical protein LIS82_27915 [Cytobacillus solani]